MKFNLKIQYLVCGFELNFYFTFTTKIYPTINMVETKLIYKLTINFSRIKNYIVL